MLALQQAPVFHHYQQPANYYQPPTMAGSNRLSWFRRSTSSRPQCEKFLLRISCKNCTRRVQEWQQGKDIKRPEFCGIHQSFIEDSGLREAYRYLSEPEPGAKVKAPKFRSDDQLDVKVLEMDVCSFNHRTDNARRLVNQYLGDLEVAQWNGETTLGPINVSSLENKLKATHFQFSWL
ncbi:hypothetical protein B0T16DRAFT_495133 [Cercophora newfieldiana]|uniref:Uncharacterized protein n=1 Tax=Cercophora newfieldiana TaxID=92897 RepID=A0AA40CMV8_9PEZI|nr:hypothetical protein B0T16DRAFT_495133 [Cercophora newfieldiana]